MPETSDSTMIRDRLMAFDDPTPRRLYPRQLFRRLQPLQPWPAQRRKDHPAPRPLPAGGKLRPAGRGGQGLAGGPDPSRGSPHPLPGPARHPPLCGAGEELATLEAALTGGQVAAVCGLAGLGGIGKSALAAHFASLYRDRFPDGVLYASLRDLEPLAVLGVLAQAYGARPGGLSRPGGAAGRGAVAAERQAGADHPGQRRGSGRGAADPALLRGAVRRAGHDARRRAGGGGRAGGAAAGAGRGGQPEAAKGVDRREGGGGRPRRGGAGRASCWATCRWRSRSRPSWPACAAGGWRELERRLRAERGRLELLKLKDLAVRTSFQLSYDLLDEGQRAFFAALGAFRGLSFDAEAAAAVAEVGDAAGPLEALGDRSLVWQEEAGRFRQHPLLAEYALERLREAGREAALLERHARHYARGRPRRRRPLPAGRRRGAGAGWPCSTWSGRTSGRGRRGRPPGARRTTRPRRSPPTTRTPAPTAWTCACRRATGSRGWRPPRPPPAGWATGGARGPTWATWASPTPTWATPRRAIGYLRAGAGHRPGDRRPAGRGEPTWATWARLRRPGRRAARHRLLRAGAGHRPGDRAASRSEAERTAAGGRGPPGQPGHRLRRPGRGARAPSATTSRRWPSPARSATGAARGADLGNLGNAYADLGDARRRHRLLRAGAGHRPGDRRPARRGNRPGQPGHRLRRPWATLARRHRLLRAGAGHRPGDRRPAGRGELPGQPGHRLRDAGRAGPRPRAVDPGAGHLRGDRIPQRGDGPRLD